jgi:hypothetical protein
VLSVEHNVIVDVRTCSHAVANQASVIAQKIKDRLPQ